MAWKVLSTVPGTKWVLMSTGTPRFIALHFIALLRHFVFLQIEGLWQPCVEQVYQRHLSNSICSLHVSVSHFGNSHSLSNFFFIIIFVMVICDQWSLMLLLSLFGGHELFPNTTMRLINKYCVFSDCSPNRLFPHLSPSPQASLFPETQLYWNQVN